MSTLRYLRERKGLTVSQLAAKSSISSRVITEYEEGTQSISLAHAKLLAKALWVGIEDLMPPAGAAPPPQVAATSSAPRPTPSPAPPAPRPQPTQNSTTTAPVNNYRPAQNSAPPREAPRVVRPVSGDGQPGRGGSATATGRGPKPTRPAPPPPGPLTEGQLLRRIGR